MKFREFTSLIVIDLLLLVTALINAFFSLPTEVSVSLPIVVFIVGGLSFYIEKRNVKENFYTGKRSVRKNLDSLIDLKTS